jgi:site-specific DNA recombinase
MSMLRVAGYIRVSSLDQVDNFSLEAQRQSISNYCKANDDELIAMYADEGKSAYVDDLKKRPQFQLAIEAVKSGRADALIVDKLDRFARNARIFQSTLHELNRKVIFIRDGIDLTTPVGKMMGSILASTAEYFSGNLAEETRKGKTERLRSGLYLGALPYGYRKQEGDDRGKLPPVFDEAEIFTTGEGKHEWSPVEVVHQVFKLAAQGMSRRDICTFFEHHISRGMVNHILGNRFYVGELPYSKQSEGVQLGLQPPIIDHALFERATRAAQANRRGSAVLRKTARPSALTGLAQCGRCGATMQSMRDKGSIRLLCSARCADGSCDQVSVTIGSIEKTLIQALDAYAPPADVAHRLAEALNGENPDIKKQSEANRQRKKRLSNLYEWKYMTESDFHTEMSQIDHDQKVLEATAVRVNVEELADMLRNLGATYLEADEPTRNELLAQVFDGLLIDDQELVSVKPKPALDKMLHAYGLDLEAGRSWRCPGGRRSWRW